MGLNFHVVCHAHKVTGMIHGGHEAEVLHQFHKEHADCAKWDPNAVEVSADEHNEKPWMSSARPNEFDDYVDIGLLTAQNWDARQTHYYKVINATQHKDYETAANYWSKRGWRIVSVMHEPCGRGGGALMLERPIHYI
jgi:hypothetical protein